jgi:hypothetical protein
MSRAPLVVLGLVGEVMEAEIMLQGWSLPR